MWQEWYFLCEKSKMGLKKVKGNYSVLKSLVLEVSFWFKL